jgi:histidine ammonia-lyase
MAIPLDGSSLSIDLLHRIAVRNERVSLDARALRRVTAARRQVETWLETDETVYGVTTGFGEFANVRIEPAQIEALQENLILSHAVGAGEPLPSDVVRGMMALRINALLQGHSGVRVETLRRLAAVLNAGIVPVIPSQGSVGASGDLVQLAHLVLALMGRGHVVAAGSARPVPAATALRRAGIAPIRLSAKEGLALINGTQMMTSVAALTVHRSIALQRIADIAGALSVEALRGSDTPFDARIHRLRPFAGQQSSAANLRRMMRGSRLRESHRHDDPRVQDAYSMRCIPQVHGASRDAIAYAERQVGIELNSVNDNPLIFPETGQHLEGGNFHGQPMALVLDFLAIALAELANISERRTERLVNGSLSGLPRFLATEGGLNSGLMIAQYTAASLVSENKVLSHPASVDSIPSSANTEDHVSMGTIAARQVFDIARNTERVLACELFAAAQGIDFRLEGGGRPALGAGTAAAYRLIREAVPFLETDALMAPLMNAVHGLVESDRLLAAVDAALAAAAGEAP